MKKMYLILLLISTMILLISCSNDKDIIKVGMDLRYPPFETVDKKDQPEGISVDIANEFGKFIGRKVKIVPMKFPNLIISLQNGTIDVIIASLSITEERREMVDFSEPYFHFKIISLLNKEFALNNDLTEDSKIEDLLEISNAKYTGLNGQVSTTIPESYGKTVKEVDEISTAIEEVSQGTSDVLLMSASPVVGGHKSHKDTTMVLWDPFESSPIAMGVKKGNSELLEKANEFINTFNNKGGMYEMLKDKWDDIILEELERYGLDFYIEK